MDKEFWASIIRNDYKIPDGHTVNELTECLFGYLSSTDPVLRDEIGYFVYANWLEQELYTKEEVSAHIREMLPHLEKGIGEVESDSVFLRAFAVLFLAEIVHNDNKKPLLEKDQLRSVFEGGIRYLGAERDARGHVPIKGWAHALAHTADLLLELGKSRFTERADQERLLQAIADKLIHSTNWVYIHGEDDRLASAVLEVLRTNSIPLAEVEAWTKSFLEPDGREWKGAMMDDGRNRAFQNTRNFLRSMYFKLLSDQGEMPNREALQELILAAVKNLKPY